jgi:hypothetical protein
MWSGDAETKAASVKHRQGRQKKKKKKKKKKEKSEKKPLGAFEHFYFGGASPRNVNLQHACSLCESGFQGLHSYQRSGSSFSLRNSWPTSLILT